VENIGRGVRTLRQRKGLTLQEVSSRSGLSVSFLSQVERGLSSLSLSSLGAICEALEVPVTYFFTARGDGPVVHKADQPRRRIRIEDSQVTYNLLSARMPDRVLEAYIADYPPHYDHPLITHEGEEFGYVVEGRLILQIGDQEHLLEPGDSFHISSAEPHTIRSKSDRPGRILWIQTEKLFEVEVMQGTI